MSNSNVVHLKKWTNKVVNSVEDDIRNELKTIIKENPDWGWEQISVQDVYAYALNQLPPIYTEIGKHPGHLLSIEEIRNAIFSAIKKIEGNPIHYVK